MKVRGVSVLLLVLVLTAGIRPVSASSNQAYQDYQFQFSQYRQKLSDYQIAIRQYKQFNSLAAQQEALVQIQQLLPQRNFATKTYLLFLNEMVTENPGLISTDRTNYREKLTIQLAFLEQNSGQVPGIVTLDDADAVNKSFVTNYKELQAAYRQTIAGVQLGYLDYFARKFDEAAAQAQILIGAAKETAPPEKHAIFDRWLLALSNQHSLYAQKAATIKAAIAGLGGDLQSQERDFTKIRDTLAQAHKDLIDGVSYLGELKEALKYE